MFVNEWQIVHQRYSVVTFWLAKEIFSYTWSSLNMILLIIRKRMIIEDIIEL